MGFGIGREVDRSIVARVFGNVDGDVMVRGIQCSGRSRRMIYTIQIPILSLRNFKETTLAKFSISQPTHLSFIHAITIALGIQLLTITYNPIPQQEKDRDRIDFSCCSGPVLY